MTITRDEGRNIFLTSTVRYLSLPLVAISNVIWNTYIAVVLHTFGKLDGLNLEERVHNSCFVQD